MAVNQRTFSKAIVREIQDCRAVSNLGTNGQPRCIVNPDGSMQLLITNKAYTSTDNGNTWVDDDTKIIQYFTNSIDTGYPYGSRSYIGGGEVCSFTNQDIFASLFYGHRPSNWPTGWSNYYFSSAYKNRGYFIETGGLIYYIYSNANNNGLLELIGLQPSTIRGFYDPYYLDDIIYFDDIATKYDGYQWYPKFSAVDLGNQIGILGTKFTSTSNTLSFVPFTKKIDTGFGTFGTTYDIDDASFTFSSTYEGVGIINPGIAIDGSGVLGVVYEKTNAAGTDSTCYYCYSSNNGGSFSTPISLSAPTNYTSNIDVITGKADHHIDIVGNSDGGFLMSAVFQDATGKADIFVINSDQAIISDGSGSVPVTSGNWTTITTGTTSKIEDIVEFSPLNNEFYAVGPTGLMLGNVGAEDSFYSVNSSATNNLYSVYSYAGPSGVDIAYSGVTPISTGYFATRELYTIGQNTALARSVDGITWTGVAFASGSLDLNCMTSCSGLNQSGIYYKYLIGTDAGAIARSVDGYTWGILDSIAHFSLTANISGLAWKDNTVGVAVGGTGSTASGFISYCKVNAGAATWYPAWTGAPIQILKDVCYGNGTFLAVGNKGTIYTSPVGSGTWVTQTSGTANNLQSCKYVNSKFVIVGDSGYFATSSTGSGSWTTANAATNRNLTSAYYSPNLSIITGASGYIAFSGTFNTTPVDPVISGTTSNWARVNSNEFTLPDKILGAQFVKYTNRRIPKFGDYSNIFIIYNAGAQNSIYGRDSVNNNVYLESIANGSAVPSVSGGGSTTFPGTPYSGTAFTNDIIDFYASGYIDANTQLYIDKIDEIGFTVDFTRWDPIQSSQVNNKLGYSVTSTTPHTCLIDPGSFGYGSVARNDTDFNEYMERDSRKLFFKPNLFLSRNFVLTRGGYLKKTLWTLRLFGNDYEIAQIVPRFLGNAILYYEANLYVVSPNNDVYSKISLPSET